MHFMFLALKFRFSLQPFRISMGISGGEGSMVGWFRALHLKSGGP